MSNTVAVEIATEAFPSIGVNYLKYAIYQPNGTVQVAAQIFPPTHPARTVMFAGLLRANYKFKLLETSDSAGNIVVRQKGGFDVIPADNSIKYKAPFYLQVDYTPNVVNNTTTFTMDGTAGTEDWRGYNIQCERFGVSPLMPTVEFSWDKTLGKFDLLTPLDVFQPSERFKIEFDIINNVAASVPTGTSPYSGTKIITNTAALVAGDAGKKIIIKGVVSNLNVTLPAISTVPDNVPFYFESSRGSHILARILAFGTDAFDWMLGLRTDIKMGRCETIAIYKNTDPADPGPYWRVENPSGNFLTVGRQYESDADAVHSINSIEMDGTALSTSDYARLYEYVLNLPPAQVVNYVDWPSNKTKFSFASGGLFFIPDRRGLVSKSNEASTKPGDYQPDMVGPISGTGSVTKANGYTGTPNNQFFGNGFNNQESKSFGITINTGNSETTVKSYRTKKYILT